MNKSGMRKLMRESYRSGMIDMGLDVERSNITNEDKSIDAMMNSDFPVVKQLMNAYFNGIIMGFAVRDGHKNITLDVRKQYGMRAVEHIAASMVQEMAELIEQGEMPTQFSRN